MKQKGGSKTLGISSILIATQVFADTAFFCQNKEFPQYNNFGDLALYEGCAEFCDCYAFELICLKKPDPKAIVFTLEQESFTAMGLCPPTQCLCNSNPDWDKWSKPANNDESLPDPLFFKLPIYQDLEDVATGKVASEDAPYQKQLFENLKASGTQESRSFLVHEINTKYFDLPKIVSSKQVPTISTGCVDQVECDFYYELNWDNYFRTVFPCGPLKSLADPCFGSKACICDNGYFQIQADMPSRSKQESE